MNRLDEIHENPKSPDKPMKSYLNLPIGSPSKSTILNKNFWRNTVK